MLARRGYICRPQANGMYEVAAHGDNPSESWTIDYHTFAEYQSYADVAAQIDQWLGNGQRHMLHICGEPLLFQMREQMRWPPEFYHSDIWDDGHGGTARLEEVKDIHFFYRLVSAGPHSTPITMCVCGAAVDSGSVKEIVDV